MTGVAHPAHCGITGRGSVILPPSQAHDDSCIAGGLADADLTGYVSQDASMIAGGSILGLDSDSAFPNANALGYATDDVGDFVAGGALLGDPFYAKIVLAYEFDNGGGASGGGATDANDVSYDSPLYATVEAALNALLYVAPKINSFSNTVNTVEIGQTITAVTLAWTLNKTMTSLSLNQSIGSVLGTTSKVLSGLSLTSGITYTLTAGDGENTAAASTSVVFDPKRYWGVSASDSLTSAEVLALGNSEFATSFGKSITYNATGGKYPYYAFPATFGTPSAVTVGGLAFSDFSVDVVSVTNASGYTQNYNVIRFSNIQTGAAISVVWA